jgi:hypothetical protein
MISLIENLTGKRWNFLHDAAGLKALGIRDGEAELATFVDFGIGLYTIINDGASDVDMVLWGRVYTVASNSRWDFMAHPDVHSISPFAPVASRAYQGDPILPDPPVEPPADPIPPTNGGTDTTQGGGTTPPA